MANTYRRLVGVATGQLGLLSRQQANGVGVSNAQLRSRVSSGSLIQVGIDTFRLPGAPAGALADLRALLLDVGGDVVASGPTAAALHGFDGYRLKTPFDVTIMRDRNVRRIGHRIHTTTCLELIDRCSVGDVASLSPARTLIDLARRSPRSNSPWHSTQVCATAVSTNRWSIGGSSLCATVAGSEFRG